MTTSHDITYVIRILIEISRNSPIAAAPAGTSGIPTISRRSPRNSLILTNDEAKQLIPPKEIPIKEGSPSESPTHPRSPVMSRVRFLYIFWSSTLYILSTLAGDYVLCGFVWFFERTRRVRLYGGDVITCQLCF